MCLYAIFYQRTKVQIKSNIQKIRKSYWLTSHSERRIKGNSTGKIRYIPPNVYLFKIEYYLCLCSIPFINKGDTNL